MFTSNSIYIFDTNIVIYESLKETIEKDHPLRSIIEYFLMKITEEDFILIPQPVVEESIKVIDDIFNFLISVLRELLERFKKIINEGYGSKNDPYIVVERFFDSQHQIANTATKSSNTYDEYVVLEKRRRLLRHLELRIISLFDSRKVRNVNDALECIKEISNTIVDDRNTIVQRILNINKLNRLYRIASLTHDAMKVYSQLLGPSKPQKLSIHESDWKIIFWQFFYQWIKNTYLILITVDFRLLKNKEKLKKNYMIFITSPLYATKLRKRIAKNMKRPKKDILNYASESWAKKIDRALARKDVI